MADEATERRPVICEGKRLKVVFPEASEAALVRWSGQIAMNRGVKGSFRLNRAVRFGTIEV